MKAEKIIHKGEPRIKVDFPYNKSITAILRQIPDAKWSQTKKVWHIPYTKEAFNQLKELFPDIEFPNKGKEKNSKEIDIRLPFSKNYLDSIKDFELWMKHKRYSDSTISSYCDCIKIFLKFLNPKQLNDIVNEDMVNFANNYIITKKLSYSYQNQMVNSVRLFFREIIHCSFDIEKIERPRREHKLPNVLSKQEVSAILSVPKNIKHKAMLSLIYACGLRRSELLNLKTSNVDSKRHLLLILNAKGKKDRIIPISDKVIEMLREYYKIYKPKTWLFEGAKVGEQYSEQSLQTVLKLAVIKAKINKPVTLHWLRHSYATHLLESGTDLRYIQELLGHSSSKTTEIYTHISTKSIQNIKSPFDDLF